MNIGSYFFEGPYTNTEPLHDNSGIYAILDMVGNNNYVIDIGESAKVKTRIESHDRQDCWGRNHRGTLAVAVHYTPHLHPSGLVAIEQELRHQFNPVCGLR